MTSVELCLDELRKRDKEKKCRYCDKKAIAKGVCPIHYRYLDYRNIDMDNVELCNKIISEKKEFRECLFCGNKHHSNGFCKPDYNFLYRNGLNPKDTNKCLEYLEQAYFNKKIKRENIKIRGCGILDKYYIIELFEEINSNINDRVYREGERLTVWEDEKCYRVVNNNMDFVPKDLAKVLFKLNFRPVEN